MRPPQPRHENLPSVTSDLPDDSGDALAQPTRARLFSRLVAHEWPVGTSDLAVELGLHPSGVRVHLERLRRAGLVSRHRIAQSRGRPRYGWQVASEARPGGEPPDAYRRLAAWLARSIPARPARIREVERAGRELGHELVQAGGGEPVQETIGRTLTALGFAPQRSRGKAGRVTFTLGSCPYREAAQENPAVVCALHRGMTQGLLDILAPEASLTGFVPKEPQRAGCQIEVDGLKPTDSRGATAQPG